MHAHFSIPVLAPLLALDHPQPSVAAFERRARAETLVVCAVAVLGALSVLLSLLRMSALEATEAVARPSALAERSAELALPTVAREEAPAPAFIAEQCEELPSALPAARPAERARWTEREHRAEFLAVADGQELALRVSQALGSMAATRAEQLAGLQALVIRDVASAPAIGARAARELALASDAQGESVPRAFVEWLAREGQECAMARAVLEGIASEPRAETQLRAAALRAWIAALPAEELAIAAARFGREVDETVYASARSSLERRRESAGADAERD